MNRIRFVGYISAALVFTLFFASCSIEGSLGDLQKEAAAYNKVKYTVTFNTNGGTVPAPSARTVPYGDTIKLPDDSGFSRSGYKFNCWNTSAGGTGKNYCAGASFTVTGAVALYARWRSDVIHEGMVWIPGGIFLIGSPGSEPGRASDESLHSVTINSGFCMGIYEVTQKQYQDLVGTNPSSFRQPVSPETNTDNYPVEQVRWYDALVFCNKLSMKEGLSPAYRISGSTDPAVWGNLTAGNSTSAWDAVQIVAGSTGYRLPTEAQWEYACRAGTTTAFNWGTDTISSGHANYNATVKDDNNPTAMATTLARTTIVGSYPVNACGLFDMHGNVWEWCWDRYGAYPGGAQQDPMGASSGADHVYRGGAWRFPGQALRSACRNHSSPNSRDSAVGFRLVCP